jgi:hypothetical protein
MKKVYLIVSTFMFGTLTFGQVNRTFMNQRDEGTRRMSTEPKEKDDRAICY